MSLRLRFTLFFSGVLVLLISGFSVLIYQQVRENAFRGAEEYLKELTQHESEHLNLPSHQAFKHEETPHYKNVYLRIWKEGGLIYDSYPPGQPVEFREGLDSATSKLFHTTSTIHEGVKYQISGYYDVSLIAEHLTLFKRTLWIGCLIALLLMLPLSWFFSKGLLRPFASLARQTSQITADELSFRLPVPKYRDEYGILARNFNSLFDRLEKTFTQLRHFAVNASHEMKTPLAVIISQMDRALRNPPKDSAALQDVFNKSLHAALRLRNIMNHLFVLAEAERMQQENYYSALRVEEIVREVVSDLRESQRHLPKSISVVPMKEGQRFYGNKELLVSVVNNLVENAVKYSHSQVKITYQTTEKDLELKVEDDGPGIPESQRETVFEPFYRGRGSVPQDNSSHGLGLSIVRACVRAQQGSIELGRSLLGGLAVSVKLPQLNSIH